MIRLDNVSKCYLNGVLALQSVSLTINPGEFVFLVGPSGSGKSTLLRLLLRDERVTTGRIFVAGHNLLRIQPGAIPQFRRRIGVVFQDYKLLPRLTAFENVAFALRVHGFHDARAIRERTIAVLELVGLRAQADRYPATLSGGEQQRVSVARALVTGPDMLLADEPTGNLDPDNALAIAELLDQINTFGTTVVVATHNRDLVDKFRRRVLQLDQGKLVRDEESGGYTLALAATGDSLGESTLPLDGRRPLTLPEGSR
ncbi:MAG: cell division ATP-binding protein FtsE [Chloroflexi bacterium]|nr:cell division ATP-binding protein FtsE [Chloroflexota bacterium]